MLIKIITSSTLTCFHEFDHRGMTEWCCTALLRGNNNVLIGARAITIVEGNHMVKGILQLPISHYYMIWYLWYIYFANCISTIQRDWSDSTNLRNSMIFHLDNMPTKVGESTFEVPLSTWTAYATFWARISSNVSNLAVPFEHTADRPENWNR